MIQSQWITSVIVWERNLAFEEERRKYHRYDPYVNYLALLQRPRKKRTDLKESQALANFVKALSGMGKLMGTSDPKMNTDQHEQKGE
jgi:hypothetical protein